MSFFLRCVRTLAYAPCNFKTTALSTSAPPKLYRYFHKASCLRSEVYLDHENQYAYSILQSKGYVHSFNKILENKILDEQQFKSMLELDWLKKSPEEIFHTFSLFSAYCFEHKLCISNEMFDTFIDCVTDNIKHATDEQLQYLFYDLKKWPHPFSIKARNYIEVWVALDDECISRYRNWSHEKTLSFLAHFYVINAIRHSDFIFKSLNKLASKAKQLRPEELVQTLFFIGLWRKSPFDMHNLELEIIEHYSSFCIDDLAIMSMGFFKSKTPIRDRALVLNLVNSVIKNAKNINEVSLASLLKLIRYSTKMTVDNRIHRLLDTLQHEVPRLSLMCNVHIALLGTTTMNMHKECLSTIADKVIKSLPETRLKDLERLVLTYATFNFIPQTKDCFFTKIMDELRDPKRANEINKHGRAFACCIAYLTILNIYPEDLISKVFTKEFLDITYGKYAYNYGREILTLHYIAEIYCKNLKVKRLDEKSAKLMSKKYTDYIPTEEFQKQYNITEKMVIDVVKVLRESRGGPQFVVGEHVLPYHQRGDILICDDHNGVPVDIETAFPPKNFGLIQKPPNDLIWTAFVISGRNALIHGTDNPTGHYISKIRDLEAIGYNATLVPWSIYSTLETTQDKVDFLNTLVQNNRKNKIRKIL